MNNYVLNRQSTWLAPTFDAISSAVNQTSCLAWLKEEGQLSRSFLGLRLMKAMSANTYQQRNSSSEFILFSLYFNNFSLTFLISEENTLIEVSMI
jgi:hypothetical protein